MTGRLFNMVDCWGCGEPVVPGHQDGPYTVGCPGCDPQVPLSEKQADMEDMELLHPELYLYRAMDEALIDAAIRMLSKGGE